MQEPARNLIAQVLRLAALLDLRVARRSFRHREGHLYFGRSREKRVPQFLQLIDFGMNVLERSLRIYALHISAFFAFHFAQPPGDFVHLIHVWFEHQIRLGLISGNQIFWSVILLRTRKWITRALENPVKRVIIAVRDRIEFVVVAARAGDGEPNHGFPEIIESVVNRQMHIKQRIDVEAAGEREISCGDGMLPLFRLAR